MKFEKISQYHFIPFMMIATLNSRHLGCTMQTGEHSESLLDVSKVPKISSKEKELKREKNQVFISESGLVNLRMSGLTKHLNRVSLWSGRAEGRIKVRIEKLITSSVWWLKICLLEVCDRYAIP